MLRGIVASLLATVLTATPVLARNAAGRAARAAGPAKALNPARGPKGFSGSSKSSGSSSGFGGQTKLGSSKSLLSPPTSPSALGEPKPAPDPAAQALPKFDKTTGLPIMPGQQSASH